MTKLELIVSLTGMAILCGTWINRHEAAQAGYREAWMQVAAAEMRASVADAHLSAILRNMHQGTGTINLERGAVAFRHGYPAASDDGIGRLAPKQVGSVMLNCRSLASSVTVETKSGPVFGRALECSPVDLKPEDRTGCRTLYVEPQEQGRPPVVSLVIDPQIRSRPCASS